MDSIQKMIDSCMTAQHPVMLSVIIGIVCGFLICFFGYKLLRLWCAIIGFAAGALISGVVAYAMGADVVLLVAGIVGIITGILSFAFYKTGVFIIGFGSTVNVAGHIMNAYDVSASWWMIVLIIAAAVIVGILAVKLVRTVVIISTALSGAASIVTNILGIFNVTNYVVILASTGIVAVLGMLYQFTHTKKKKDSKSESEALPENEQAEQDMLPSDEHTMPNKPDKLPDEEVWTDSPNLSSDSAPINKIPKDTESIPNDTQNKNE